jgi:hypothetical protein
VLEKHGWMYLFDDDFGAELKARLMNAFPEKRQRKPKACKTEARETSNKLQTRAMELQPSLF